MELSYVTYSQYSGESSTLVLSNWASAFDCRSEECLEEDKEEYDPLADKFVIIGVEVNNCVYLKTITDGSFSYPAGGEVSSDPAIIHGPDVINGYEDENIFLGVVTNVHNKLSVMYNWFHNGNPICNGPHRCLINIKEPGTYFCQVMYGEIELQSSTVDIQSDCQAITREKPCKDSGTGTVYPASVSIATLLEAGKIVIPQPKRK